MTRSRYGQASGARPDPMRHCAVAAGILALSLTAGSAEAQVTPCAGTAPFDDTLAALEADGWTIASEPGALAPHIDRLAWTLMLPYLADDGGEDIATLLDLQRRAVPGLLAKRDTDATRARVLIRGDGAMTLTETRTTPDRVERTCRIARDATAGPGTIDTSTFPDAPALTEIATILPEEPKP